MADESSDIVETVTQGGSYIRDPETGALRKVAGTEPAPPPEPPTALVTETTDLA